MIQTAVIAAQLPVKQQQLKVNVYLSVNYGRMIPHAVLSVLRSVLNQLLPANVCHNVKATTVLNAALNAPQRKVLLHTMLLVYCVVAAFTLIYSSHL